MPQDPRTKKVTTWIQHKTKWSNCSGCFLSGSRSNVVLLRGHIPADIIFVGEAPGGSEDTLGRPFCGPAGKLLNDMVEHAVEAAGAQSLKFAYTNLIACIPLAGETKKLTEPPLQCVKACSPRLQEIVELCRPLGIVMVGRLAGKLSPEVIDWDFECSTEIYHPAYILRAQVISQGMAIQKTTLEIEDMFRKCLKIKERLS